MNWSFFFACIISVTRTLVFCEEPTCTDIPNGRVCTDINPNRLATADNGKLLIVGTDDFLHSFDTTKGFTLKQTANVAPNQETLTECTQNNQALCKNSIRVIQQIPQSVLDANATLRAKFGNTILVCGTNAFNPRCTVHNIYNISDWSYLSPIEGDGDLGFVPYSNHWTNIGTMTTGGKFYSATNFEQFTTRTRLVVSSNPLSGDTSFTAASHDRDPFWVSQTDFVSLHELPNHMYFFGREDSYEVQGVNEKFGRVMRVCKTDEGIVETGSTVEIPRFKTFQKIRITCPDASDRSFFTYNYNELQATHLYWPSEGSQSPILYAAFTSPANGPTGSAICKFSFDPAEENSLSYVFNTDSLKYYKSDPTNLQKKIVQQFVCPGETGRQRERDESLNYLLLDGVALPSGGNAMHTVQGQFFTHICVDVYDFSGSKYEVMFVGTWSKTVRAIEYKDGNVLLTHTVFEYSKNIGHVILDKSGSASGNRKLFIAGENFVASVTLGVCEKHLTCKECLESNDPYCAWQSNSQLCINKLISNSTTPVLEATEANINMCPSATSNSVSEVSLPPTQSSQSSTLVPDPSATVTSSTTTSQRQCGRSTSTVIDFSTSTVFIVVEPSEVGVESRSSQGISVKDIGEYIGVGLGGLVVGIVLGVLILYFGTTVVMRGKTSKQDEEEEEPVPSSILMANGHQNGSSRAPRVEQYTVTINLPGDEKPSLSPVPSCVSPPVVDDSELEDDAIGDLPTGGPHSHQSNNGRIKKWSIPKGRTPSTRWLRASESSMTGSESPVSPL